MMGALREILAPTITGDPIEIAAFSVPCALHRIPSVSVVVPHTGTTECGKVNMSISASEARRTLFPLIEQVIEDRTAVEIVSRNGSAVLMAAEDYAAWHETAYLFRSPANARRLLDSYERARAGEVASHELDRDC